MKTHGSTRPLVVLAASLVLLAGACGDEATVGGDGVRTIEIDALDTPAFSPERVEVDAGETVRFVVRNVGAEAHEFVLGNEAAQAAHGRSMDGMDDMDSMDGEAIAALQLAPGSTREVTVTFDEPGELIYGCHEPGHYEAGMLGTVSVT
jgi:uncharacterized cupredoxin-like copper-binding protein